MFQNGLGLTIKTASAMHYLKPLKTASTNSPWAYIWEGLFIYLFIYFYFFFFGGGRAYYRNFTVIRGTGVVQGLSSKSPKGFAESSCPSVMKSTTPV